MKALHRNVGPPGGVLQYNNQLQFNLNVPSHSVNIATNYQHPGPITLEKVGIKTKEGGKSIVEDHQNVVKLSQASEEKLSWALQLARRDLKNMIHQQKAKAEEEEKKSKQNVPMKKKKKKISTTTKSTKFAVREPSQNVFKKSVKTQTPPTKVLYYSKRGVLNNNLPPGSAEKLFRSSTPVRPSAQIPENKADTEKAPDGKENLSPSSRQAGEIKKLRHELKFYIQKIEDLAKEAQLTASPLQRDEDEKDVLRRKVKKAEQTNRSSRLLYSLHQQVRELQEDLKRAGPRKIKQSKRSQILGRLAAVHRRAVRILQAFLHQLPEQVTDEGTLPPLYQELGELIHKLSLCTRQLEIDGNGIPDDVFAIFQKFQTPQRLYQSPEINRRRSPAPINSRRKLDFGKNLFSGQSHSDKPTVSPLFKEYVHPRQVHHLSPSGQFTPGLGTAQRLRSDVARQIATPGSPERNAAIKAGLQALMRIEGPETMKGEDLKKTKPLSPKKRPLFQRKKKGTLFPSNAKSFKAADSRRGSDKTRSANYLQATKASQLKVTERKKEVTEKDKLDEKPPWAPPGSPRSFHRSPTQRKQQLEEEEDVEEAAGEPKQQISRTKRVLFEDEEENVKNVDANRGEESSGRLRDGRGFNWPKNDGFDGRSDYHGNSMQAPTDVEAIINQAEKRILERIVPLLATTDDTTNEHGRQQRTRLHPSEQQARLHASEQQAHLHSSEQQKQPQSMTEKVTDQAGRLGDLLLEDVLEDTTREMEGIQREDEAERLAFNLENSSTLETMLQTLERMEAEEERIRRRWRRVSYRDPVADMGGKEGPKKDLREVMMGTPLEGDLLERLDEPPVSHTGIQITTETVPSGRIISISEPGPAESPIHSFNSESPFALVEEDSTSAQESLHSWSNHPDRQFTIRMSSDLKRRVTENQETFKDYLKKKSHLSYGEFDPWKLISEVSDDLVDGILKDVVEEMVDFSGDFMDAIYKTEFAEEVK